jgi:hypothetical protein
VAIHTNPQPVLINEIKDKLTKMREQKQRELHAGH